MFETKWILVSYTESTAELRCGKLILRIYKTSTAVQSTLSINGEQIETNCDKLDGVTGNRPLFEQILPITEWADDFLASDHVIN